MKNKMSYLLLFISALSLSSPVIAALPFFLDDSPTLAPLVEQVSPAVVNISVSGKQIAPSPMNDLFEFFNQQRPNQTEQPFVGLGSGVIIDAKKGYIITNQHVIDSADEIQIELKSGQILNATLIGQDKQSDIALLKVETNTTLSAMPFADSDKLRVGDFALAIGNPFGLGQTVTLGIISALGRSGLNIENLENFIQTDAAINSGNSGGALVNLQGQLIGINTAILGPNGGNIGIAFAIPANMVKNIVEQLLEHGEVRRGILGVRGGEITAELAKSFALESQHGAFVYQVNSDSAAQEAGIKAGDVITAVNGRKIKSFAELRAKVGTLGSGKTIKLAIIRDGKSIVLQATLKPPQAQPKGQTSHVLHPALSGAMLTNKANNQGVTIKQVQQGSMAEHVGLQRADIIIGINRTLIHNIDELQQMIDSQPAALALNIKRGEQHLYLMLD
ncbi:DegQ family serine endoprotease [Psychromonas hadalis]|uniref:DegQ family serine endoprotease n=1 Tax=Psychromonas hadalis TaxID=211669 RepID=UPI0003B44ADE|nr:DegQ family serine endoprotease [Psychromonas hadalis]